MRYDKTVYLVKFGDKSYGESTGDYTRKPESRIPMPASVMDTKRETQILLYKDYPRKSLTVQIQNHYPDPFDRIEIEGERYQVDSSRKLRTKETFIVSEVK